MMVEFYLMRGFEGGRGTPEGIGRSKRPNLEGGFQSPRGPKFPLIITPLSRTIRYATYFMTGFLGSQGDLPGISVLANNSEQALKYGLLTFAVLGTLDMLVTGAVWAGKKIAESRSRRNLYY